MTDFGVPVAFWGEKHTHTHKKGHPPTSINMDPDVRGSL